MLTYTVILTLMVNAALGMGNNGFRMIIYSRSVDNENPYQSPCPHIFQYQTDENGKLIGFIRVDQTDGTGYVQLDVELSVGNRVPEGYNGRIVPTASRQKVIDDIRNRNPIHYRVEFPVWENIPPKITKISVNGNLICTGPGIPYQSVAILTLIKLQHKLTLDVVTPLSSSDTSPNINNVDINNANKFDVRAVDNYPSATNIDFTDFRRPNRPPPPPPDRPPPNNPFFNSNNPFNFNPTGPPPRGGRPPFDPRPSGNGGINPNNPFLNGLSTPQPSRDDERDTNGKEDPSVLIKPTQSSPPQEDSSISSDIRKVCGRPLATNQLVVKGQSVSRGAYPWLVAIFRQKEDDLSLNYICSGSLISNRHVLTAAHCLKLEYRRMKPNEIICVFGKLNIMKWTTTPGALVLEPETITVHPDYQYGKANADLGMITFSDPIPFSSTILPLCLWQGSNDIRDIVGDIGTVVGWGRTENGDLSSAEPRQVNMPVVDHLDCVKSSSPVLNKALVDIISHTTFCAGSRNGSGPCNGDSGSAFLLRKHGVFYLRGVVSTSLSDGQSKSCNLDEYIVFADASKYLDWIGNLMKTT